VLFRRCLLLGTNLNIRAFTALNEVLALISTNEPGKTLPNDVLVFIKELEDCVATTDGTRLNKNNSNTKLKQLITKYREDPNTCLLLLQKTLDFEEKHPGFRGLVDEQSIFYVLQNFVTRDQVEKADELLTVFQSRDSIQPSSKCYGIVLNRYAKRKSLKALKRIEEMLAALEEERLRASGSKTIQLDRYGYTILMNAYLGLLGKQSVAPIRRTMDRIQKVSERLEDDSLRPSLPCYTILMKAYMLERQPGFALKVNDILDQFKTDKNYFEQPEKDRACFDSLAIDAWSKSGDSQAINRARQIFDAIDKPNTVIYSALCNIYSGVGNADEVFRLYEDMQSDCNSGKNKNCQPNMHTYSTILNALQLSNRPDAIEKAEQIFSTIPLPDAVAYSTFINILAKKGDVARALNLLHEMQSDFKSGKNKNCHPNMHTYSTILNALQKSNLLDAA
jgi:pentatricopeptide repeat protein